MQKTLIKNDTKWFFFTMLFLVVDYVRPQDLFPGLAIMKPGMLTILILSVFLILRGSFYEADSKQTRMIFLFIALLAVFVPFAVNNFMAYTTVKTMILFVPFILSVIICVNSMERLKTLIFIGICIMIYIALYGFLHNGVGSGNYFRDENDLSLYINMWLPFCFYLFLYEKRWVLKAVYAFGLVMGLVALVTSFSRGGFIGLVIIALTLCVFSPRKIMTISIISIIALVMLTYSSQEYWREMSTVTDKNESTAQARIQSWQTAWDMFLDNPLGVGGNNFQVRFPEYQGERFLRGMWGRVAHSLWFTLIPETGIFGLLIYLMLLYYNINDIFKIMRLNQLSSNPDSRFLYLLSLSLIASLAGFFASATFLSVLYYPHYWYMTAIIVASVNISKRNMEVSAATPMNSDNTILVVHA